MRNPYKLNNPHKADNPYLPQKARIEDVVQETSTDIDIKTYKFKIINGKPMDFMPGQFVELSVPGTGEAPFGFVSSPLDKEYFELSVKRTGAVTEAVHNLKPGSVVWVRGPFGNAFPAAEMEGSNILYIAGGLGLAPLRPLILYMLDRQNRKKYAYIRMLFAARSSGDFVYKREFEEWQKIKDLDIVLTIDNPEDGWNGRVGFPHVIVPEMDIDAGSTYAIICGPPVMIKMVLKKLADMRIPEGRIFTTLEMRMTCGIGKCGKCNIGRRYVCVDGPVFSMADLGVMPAEY